MNANLLALATGVVPDDKLLINMVRLRVRQLSVGHRPLAIVPPGMQLADIALSEIAAEQDRQRSRHSRRRASWQQAPNHPPLSKRQSRRGGRLISFSNPFLFNMSTITPPETGEQLDARAYRRAHQGKVMVIMREEGRKLSAEDFFYLR